MVYYLHAPGTSFAIINYLRGIHATPAVLPLVVHDLDSSFQNLTAFPPHAFLATTTSTSDGHKPLAFERTRKHCIFSQRSHRSFESRKGDLKRHSSKGRFWLSQRPSRYVQSTSLKSTLTAHWFTIFQDSMVNEQDYVELGLSCADVCKALERGLEGRRVKELSKSMLGAIGKSTT